jgi:hypothetical protein
MSYKHINETGARLKTEIDARLAAAEKTNAEEDAQYGKNRRGDELPDKLQRRESQMKKIAEVTQETNDKKQLLPMIAQIETNLEQKPEKVSADTGYFSEANVTDQSIKEVDLYVEAVPDWLGSGNGIERRKGGRFAKTVLKACYKNGTES